MSLVTMKVNPAELRLIREALQELVELYKAHLLADGYLAPPLERVQTTIADVSAPTGPEIWNKIEEQRKLERQMEQLTGAATPPPSMDLSYLPQVSESRHQSLGMRVHDAPLPPEQSDLL